MDSVYERALNEVGYNGKFQRHFDILYNFVFICLWGIAYNSIILSLVIIPHWCEIPKTDKNVSEIFWKDKYIPLSTDSTGKSIYSSCTIYTDPDVSNVTQACESFVYNNTWYETTIPSVNDWVCDKEIYVANIFAYGKIGEAIGSVLFGWSGDLYGRRISYIVSLSLLVLGRAVSILFHRSYILFTIGCVIAWFPSWTVVQSATVISMEISSPKRRSKIATLRTIGFSSGMCLMPLLYWWLRDWKLFMIVTTVTQIPFVIFSWKIIESPRWLWIEGKANASVKVLRQIAKVNNAKLESATEEEILTRKPENKIQILGPLSLFSGWTLAKNTILQLYQWVSVSLIYVVLLMSSSEKSDGNPFLEFAWQSLVELPATFVGAWLADNLGRRYAGAISFCTSALMWLLIFVKETGIFSWMQVWWFASTLVIFNRLATTVTYYVIYLFNMELYPTALRQSGMSIGNVFSSGGSAIAPYLMYIGRRVDVRLPGAILFLVAILGMISSLLLPETLNAKLPETVQEAKDFGRTTKQKYETINVRTT